MVTMRQLPATLAGGKRMSAASHCTYCRGVGGRGWGAGGWGARSDSSSTELCTQQVRQRETEKEGSEGWSNKLLLSVWGVTCFSDDLKIKKGWRIILEKKGTRMSKTAALVLSLVQEHFRQTDVYQHCTWAGSVQLKVISSVTIQPHRY